MKTSEARIKELDRKLGASCLEELALKKALSEAHAESERLSAAAEDLHRKYQAATSGENLLKLVVIDHKRTITPPNKFCGNHRTYFFSSLDTKSNTITKLIDY